ncbi:hypothetical protein M5204_002669 [Vibrio vulnificus]|nr:hypothetical protein [Vibrio vulnificus]EME0156025.1 hypothetical protein [Vibrio vulnificus]HAS8562107.1 hypothetical protein [Vibrio vulnificus]
MRWFAIALFVFHFSAVAAQPKTLTLVLPTQLDGSHLFYHELLRQSLDSIGVKLTIKTPFEHIPQKRLVKMVENNQLSLMWLLQTKERDAQYPYVNAPVTNGLIGQRVLLIPKGAQPQYDSINSLDELRQSGLTAGLGYAWYDVDVWLQNDLPFYEQDGEWRMLYHKLSTQGSINYFPRGVNEVMAESRLNPQLEIEQHLLLIYQRDFRFYLSEGAKQHKALLERALIKAEKSGLLQRLIDQYWATEITQLQLNKRKVLKLVTP